MPLLKSDFRHSSILFNYHLQTIYPALFRKINSVNYTRERIDTPDDDFLDLDWSRAGSDKLVILSHGLEGNSERAYIKGMAKFFNEHGFDALAWNYRGCSEEMNRQLIMYHSGATYDLERVTDHAGVNYDKVYLVGFSLGGNLTLKYLGEKGSAAKVSGSVIFSVPMDLHNSSLRMNQPGNRIYTRRFIRHLKEKVIRKSKMYPDKIDSTGIKKGMSIYEFDDLYTAPLHGFKDAADYYRKSSSLYFLDKIRIPTLIVNARNDSFLSESCYPEDIDNPSLFFEYPKTGGHVGFTPPGFGFPYWSEKRALDFILSLETKP